MSEIVILLERARSASSVWVHPFRARSRLIRRPSVGRAVFEAAGLAEHPGIRMCDPLGYLEFMSLVRGAAAAITDSAGVQEETTFLRVPCLTLRPVTERPVTVTSGSNRLVRADELASAVQDALARGPYPGELPPLWDGASGPRIAGTIVDWLATRS